MIKVYGSKKCPDCIACEYNFDKYGIEYEFIDITDELANLKKFLRYRDNDPAFDFVRGSESIGIPACVKENGMVFLDWEKYLKNKGFEPEEVKNSGTACSLDRKSC